MKDNDYLKQALDFLEKHDCHMTIKFLKYDKYFPDDTENRNIYTVKLVRRGVYKDEVYTFKFGQSINKTISKEPPNEYDVLSCLTKYDPETFEDFCANFGYDTDSINARKVYKAVQKEYDALSKMFTEKELEEMQEIQ